jgi:flavin-dependent dehydrogenase
MDHLLLRKARSSGAEVLEGFRVIATRIEHGNVVAVEAVSRNGNRMSIAADLFVDATGRSAFVHKLVARCTSKSPVKTKPKVIAFKAHIEESNVPNDICEIYSFPGGYGGLSPVGNGLANLCFMIGADKAKIYLSDPDTLVKELISLNDRARQTLEKASPVGRWLSAAITEYGKRDPVDAQNLLLVGDSAAFIDPFTGSGMLMALESASLLANTISEFSGDPRLLRIAYNDRHHQRFSRRLWVSSALRNTAFHPVLVNGLVRTISVSDFLRKKIVCLTRQPPATH